MTTPITPTPPPALGESVPQCPNCGAALARDQRYCLNCGQRLTEPRVDFHQALGLHQEPPAPPPRKRSWDQRVGLITLAAVAAIVVALGVGIVIGRGKGGTTASQKPTVITVAGGAAAPATGTGTTPAATAQPVASITEDWPNSKSGWTVELSALDKSSAQASDVNAAKTSATSKGAKDVGVLDGDAHSGTPSGKYVIYSGDFSSKKDVDTAQTKLKKRFPGALVLHVQPKGSGGSNTGGSSAGSQGLNQAAAEQHLSGSAFEKASAKLPSAIGTGGAPPPKDNKKAGGGSSATCIGC